MSRGSRGQLGSPSLPNYDMASTPLFDDPMDVVIFDTTVEFLPGKTRTRTALNAVAHVENLKELMLESRENHVPLSGSSLAETSNDFRHAESTTLAHSCYQMTVELESPSEGLGGPPLDGHFIAEQLDQESSMVSVFRAFRCMEGDEDLPQKDPRFLPLEVRRPQRPRPGLGSSSRHSSGYFPVSQDVTIDY
nr:uncharacterized protein LOC123764032 [Procambarus clarkii]